MNSLSNLSNLSFLPDLSQQRGTELRCWMNDGEKAFDEWVVILDLKISSQRVKASMWVKFYRWMMGKGVGLDRCTKAHIESFFKEAKIRKEQRYRYIRLLEQVYAHLIFLGLSMKNPGQEASYARLGEGANDPMQFFGEDDRAKMARGLRGILGECLESKESQEREDSQESDWALVRDAALCGVLWGGGLRVSEVGKLSVNCTYDADVLIVPAAAPIPEHRAQLFPIATLALNTWVPMRQSLKIDSHALFPPDLSRRRDSLPTPSEFMHPSNIYRRVNALLKRFGLSGKRISPQTLRNTYAAMGIEAGWTNGMIMSSMALVEDTTLIHLRSKHKVWQNSPITEEHSL